MAARHILSVLTVLAAAGGGAVFGGERAAGEVSAAPSNVAQLDAAEWVAAKFLHSPAPPNEAPGLHVLEAYGPVLLNAQADLPLKLGGVVYRRGFYCHANSRILVRLPGAGKTFEAAVGVNSNHMTEGGRGSIVASVIVGEKPAYQSPVLREGMEPAKIAVGLGGATSFVLAVGDSGDGISCDQSAWIDAKVTLDDGRVVWLGDMRLWARRRKPFDEEPPFSFQCADKSSRELLATWTRTHASRRLDDCRTEHVIRYTQPGGGLSVRCVAVEYRDFPTIEWTVYLKNEGNGPSDILSEILPLDLRFCRGAEGEFVLNHHTGDLCTPNSYEPHRDVLGTQVSKTFASVGGRPTTGSFPYFNIEWPGGGAIAAIGWPGQWEARFVRDEADGLRVCGGQQQTHLRLLAGEEIRTPLVVVQFWQGDRVDAQNVWRRWMLAHNLPRPGGAPAKPILASCSGGFFPGLKCNEKDEMRFLDALRDAQIPLTHWWMDAGWYPCGDGWPNVGTWTVDAERFPRGLKAVSDRVHAGGMKLIVWFEPERVVAGSWLATNHPEWILGGAKGGLLNLGDERARHWLTDHVDQMLSEQGIDLYRQDFNIDPLGFWRANDAADRQGITEIRHVEGYLAYWDELLRRHPGMLIDSCASGGRRNDLETLRRAVPLLRSDYQSFAGDPSYAPGNQGHTYALASWIPYFGQGTYYNPKHTVYNARSHFCPAFGFCVDVRIGGTDWPAFRRIMLDWQAIAEDLLLGDYYPLTPYSLDAGTWMAWQFHRPETGTGFVQAFRRDASVFESARFRLRGLEPNTRYRVTQRDAPGAVEHTGRELATHGLSVAITEEPGAVIYTYAAVQ